MAAALAWLGDVSIFDLVGQLLAGWLFADFLSGVGHWFEDEIAKPEWPLIGAAIVLPNLMHHEKPLAFAESGVVGRGLITWCVAAFVGGLLFLAFGVHPWIFAAIAGGLVVNEVHFWAHRPTAAPAFIRVLQEIGLVQSPRIHAAHHRHEMNSAYCVLTGWLNPVLDGIGFWRRLEHMIGVK